MSMRRPVLQVLFADSNVAETFRPDAEAGGWAFLIGLELRLIIVATARVEKFGREEARVLRKLVGLFGRRGIES